MRQYKTFNPHSLTGRDGRKQTLASPHISYLYLWRCLPVVAPKRPAPKQRCAKLFCAKTAAPKRSRQNGGAKLSCFAIYNFRLLAKIIKFTISRSLYIQKQVVLLILIQAFINLCGAYSFILCRL